MKERNFIFKIQNKEIERVTWDIAIDDIDIIKGCLALTHGINVEDIEMETIEIYKPELSEKLFIRPDGSLMCTLHANHLFYVNGLQPSVDINHEELFYEFLDLITKKEFDKAITFC